jgi:SRSO17 transposase
MIDELTRWGLQPPLIVADAGYGDAAEFRHGLTERGAPYVVQVSTKTGVHRHDTIRTAPPYRGDSAGEFVI